MANGGVYDGSGPRGGNKNVISRGGGNQNIAVRRPQRRKVKATADVRGTYANPLPPAHQLALHILTNGQYGLQASAARKRPPSLPGDLNKFKPGAVRLRRREGLGWSTYLGSY